jgi:hypothetical protein
MAILGFSLMALIIVVLCLMISRYQKRYEYLCKKIRTLEDISFRSMPPPACGEPDSILCVQDGKECIRCSRNTRMLYDHDYFLPIQPVKTNDASFHQGHNLQKLQAETYHLINRNQ